MAAFVINEWLWHDLSGDNGRERQLQAISLIADFGVSQHQVVVIEGSKFDQKAWGLCKSVNQLAVQGAVAFVVNIRLNLDKCIVVKPDQLGPFPEELLAA